MAPHSTTPAWKIPWTEEPGRLWSMGSLWVGHDWATSLSFFTLMHWRRNGNPLQCSCLQNPRDGGAGGLLSMGLHRVRHDWRDLAAAAEVCCQSFLNHILKTLADWQSPVCVWKASQMVTRYMSISCFSVCDARKGPEFHSSPSLFDIEEEFPSCLQLVYIFLVFS